MKVSNPQDSDSGLTCVSCRLLFNDAQDQKAHYKTDLHLFNLKRKIANLPPVTQEVYKMKLEGIQLAIKSLTYQKHCQTKVQQRQKRPRITRIKEQY